MAGLKNVGGPMVYDVWGLLAGLAACALPSGYVERALLGVEEEECVALDGEWCGLGSTRST